MTIVTLEGNNDGPLNMARDLDLLHHAEAGRLGARVYGWQGAWVSLGRSQKPERALLPGCAVPHVARPTGGKAVLHGHDVTIGLALPLDVLGLSPGHSRSVGPVYRRVVGVLVRALQQSGVRADLGENVEYPEPKGHTADCFAHVAPNDIVDPSTGQKLCGCALRVTQNAVLVQASIPASRPLVTPNQVFSRPSASFWIQLDASEFAAALDDALRGTATRSSILT